MTRLEFARRSRGLTQRDLCREAGLGVGALDWLVAVEGGYKPKRLGPRAEAIARALDLRPEDLTNHVPQPRPSRRRQEAVTA
jgi:transcriptional regulator with XRE-family HTH domain